MFLCTLCQSEVKNVKKHLADQCVKRAEYISDLRSSSASCRNGNQMCLHCMTQFTNRGLLNKHLKSCNRQKRSSHTRSRVSVLSAPENNNIIDEEEEEYRDPNPTKKHHQDTLEQERVTITVPYSQDSNLSRHLLNSVLSQYGFIIDQFLKRNKGISDRILHQIFTNHLQSCYKYIQDLIPQVNLYNLYNKGQKGKNKIVWRNYVKESTDLMNQELIIRRINSDENLQADKKLKIYKYINEFIKKLNIPVFPLFKLSKPEKQILSETPRPLLFDDLVKILKHLFSTKKTQYIHLGLDVLLMFVSGVRFPSSHQIVQQVLSNTLKEKPDAKTITITIASQTKTKKPFTLYYNAQVVFLLRLIKWTGFMLTKQQMERISKIFPFTAFDLRRGYMNYLIEATSQRKDVNSYLATFLSQHTGQANFEIYIRKFRQEQLASVKDKMVFQTDLTPSFKDDYVKSSFTRHAIQIPKDWFKNVEKFFFESKPDKEQQITHEEQIDAEVEEQLEEQFEDDEFQDQDIPILKIQAKQYSFKDEKFNIAQLCTLQNNNYVCNFCQKIVKNPDIFCSCMKFQRSQQHSSIKWAVDSIVKIIMPENYIANDDYDQIRFLTYARNYYFTTVPVLSSAAAKMQIPSTVGELKLPNFKDYISGKYFPPIKIGLYGQRYATGPGFGIFASGYIQSGSLICQYAADMILIQQQRFVKRQDMIFRAGKNKNQDKISIAPVRYCGLGPLINSNQSKQKVNCASGTFVVDGKSRILIYAIMDIREGQQLIYNYSRQEQSKLVRIPQKTKICRKKAEVLLVKNKANRCYLIACLQSFSHLKDFLNLQIKKAKTKFFQCFFELIEKKNQIINIDHLAQFFFERFTMFQKSREEDTLVAFSKVCEGLVQDQSINMDFLSVNYISKIRCSNCNRSSQKQQVYFTLTNSQYEKIFQQSQPSQLANCQDCHETTLATTGYWKIPIMNKVIVFEIKQGQKYHQYLQIDKRVYKATFALLRRGQDTRSGHIWCYNLQQKVQIDGHVPLNNELKDHLLTALIYVKENTLASIPQIPFVEFDVKENFEEFLTRQEDKYRGIGAIKIRLLNFRHDYQYDENQQINIKCQKLEKIDEGVFYSTSIKQKKSTVRSLETSGNNINSQDDFWLKMTQKKQYSVWYAPDQLQPVKTNFSNVKTTFNKIIREKIQGINTSFCFYGTSGSYFGWHTEDYHLSAINIQLYGSPKIWYIVPSSHFNEFRQFYQNYRSFLQNQYCPHPHLHKNLFVDPLKLFHRFPVFKVTQNVGEMILTFPKSSHWGLNMGFNVNQAFNVGDSISWLRAFKDFKNCDCSFKIPPLNRSLLKTLKCNYAMYLVYLDQSQRTAEFQDFERKLEENNIFD